MDALVNDARPILTAGLVPPPVRGPAVLAHLAFGGADVQALTACIRRPTPSLAEAAAFAFDAATVQALQFRADAAEALQRQAFAAGRLFRVADSRGTQSARPLRVLGVMAPGDLMANTPLDFITMHLDVRLDLLFMPPGQPLPERLPDHDLAFFAAADTDPAVLQDLAPWFAAWPRPALNDPARVLGLGREALTEGLAGIPGLVCPPIRRLTLLDALAAVAAPLAEVLPGADYPVLVRPAGSHAGHDLGKAEDPVALFTHLRRFTAGEVFLSAFVDYRGRDGLYRKYRIAFIQGAPFLCHMAISEHWMVHYLNAGMAESAAKRAAEAQAMANFETGFAARHAAALQAIAAHAELDYFQIDCAETPDGRLLLFEADVAGIIHMMDPPELYPYKPPQMRRVIEAFGAMLQSAARREAG